MQLYEPATAWWFNEDCSADVQYLGKWGVCVSSSQSGHTMLYWALELKSLLTLELTTGVEAMNGKRVSAVHTPTTRGINNGQTLDSCKGNMFLKQV